MADTQNIYKSNMAFQKKDGTYPIVMEDRPEFDPFYANKLSTSHSLTLVEVLLTFNFDGWFFNIEAPLRNTYDSRTMKTFLEYITNSVKLINPDFQIIWYDSLIDDGKIAWQNRLCERNKMFFDVVDAIFTNYTWQIPHIIDTVKHAQLNGIDRRKDVFIGTDVWGRGTFGGGGWNSHKALRVCEQYGLSKAIFAPGWTFEHFNSENFELLERRFWCDFKGIDISKIVGRITADNDSTNNSTADMIDPNGTHRLSNIRSGMCCNCCQGKMLSRRENLLYKL
jgi:hypothetical protein